MKTKYNNIGTFFLKEIKSRKLTIENVSKATNIPYASLHNILHNNSAKLYIEKLGIIADYLSIKQLTLDFTSNNHSIKEDDEQYNAKSIDLNKVTPETAKLILKLYYNDENIKNRLGL